tara:strand:- start:157 stop:699 length:543 start_codon:yes stop_codon:yes gene_type:complete
MKKVDKEKIIQLFKEELLSGLRHLYINSDKNGIRVFGDYLITKTDDGYYSVSKQQWEENRDFLSVRNAMSYCVLLNNCKNDVARRLYQLDCKLASVNLDIEIHTKGYQNKGNSIDARLVQLTKLQSDYERKQQILKELQKHINKSKEEQLKIFESVKKSRYKNAKNSIIDDKYIYSSTDY